MDLDRFDDDGENLRVSRGHWILEDHFPITSGMSGRFVRPKASDKVGLAEREPEGNQIGEAPNGYRIKIPTGNGAEKRSGKVGNARRQDRRETARRKA